MRTLIIAVAASAIGVLSAHPSHAAEMCSDTDTYIGKMIVDNAKKNKNVKYIINGVTGCARFVCISSVDKKCGGNAFDLYKHYNDRRLVHPVSSPPPGAIVFYVDAKRSCSSKLPAAIRTYGHVAISLGKNRALSVIKSDGSVGEHGVETLYEGIAKGATGCMIQGWVGPRDFVVNFPK